MTLENTTDLPTSVSQDNPLLAAASPLLNAIVQIRLSATHDDPAGLRQQLIDEIRQFESRSKRAGLPFDMIMGARYCLCSVLDEAAAQTPWGTRGIWSGNGLLITFHNESWGGEKVFQLLSRISQTPTQHLWLLEVIHYILLLGYEGRYRSIDQGRTQRDGVRSRLGQLIANTRGVQPPLPAMQPLLPTVQHSLWRPPVPLWACITLTAFIACLIYTGLNWRLGNAAEPLLRAIWETPLPKGEIGRRSVSSQALLDLRDRLGDLISARQLDVTDGTEGSRVIIPLDTLFSRDGSDLTPQGRAIISRVAAAMDSIQGRVLVSVFTDDRPARNSHYSSNYESSQAQAQVIAARLHQQMKQPGHTIRGEGRGDSSPLLPNDSIENRTLNRRVEITLLPAPQIQASTTSKTGKY